MNEFFDRLFKRLFSSLCFGSCFVWWVIATVYLGIKRGLFAVVASVVCFVLVFFTTMVLGAIFGGAADRNRRDRQNDREHDSAMAVTNLKEAIRWIQECPKPSTVQVLVRVLAKNEREFDRDEFQFTVSMYTRLNVMLDDGYRGIRGPEHNDYNWFTLGASEEEVRLCIGNGSVVLGTRSAPEEFAAALIRAGIRHLHYDGEPIHPA